MNINIKKDGRTDRETDILRERKKKDGRTNEIKNNIFVEFYYSSGLLFCNNNKFNREILRLPELT